MKRRIDDGQVRKGVFAKMFVEIGQRGFGRINMPLCLVHVFRLHNQFDANPPPGAFPFIVDHLKMGRGRPGKIDYIFGMIEDGFGAVLCIFSDWYRPVALTQYSLGVVILTS